MAGKKREIAKKVVEKTGKATSKTVETVTGSDDGKSLFFLILSLSCFYLILDVFYGDNKLLKMAQSIFGVSSVADSEERNSIWNTKDFGKYPSGSGYGGAGDGGRKAIDKFWEKWYKENYPYSINNITFHIDKDLTQMDNINKIYSPKTVTFIPAKINNFILIYKNNFLDVGNSFDKENNKWVSRIKDFKTNKNLNLGRFSTPEEASQAYQIARAENAEKAKQYLRDLNYLPEEIIQLIK